MIKEEWKSLKKSEFLTLCRPETRIIAVNGEIIANLGDKCICDFCNADVYPEADSMGYGLFINDSKYPSDLICSDCYRRIKSR